MRGSDGTPKLMISSAPDIPGFGGLRNSIHQTITRSHHPVKQPFEQHQKLRIEIFLSEHAVLTAGNRGRGFSGIVALPCSRQRERQQ
jgi:hypothetical protein